MGKIPAWVLASSYNSDEMCKACEEAQDHPFLYTGKKPAKGQRVFVHLEYLDKDRECHARMMGIVTNVFNPPPVGAYAIYADEEEPENWKPLEPLPGTQGSSYESLTRAEAIEKNGAVHGQRVAVEIAVVPGEESEHPRLQGTWNAVLVLNDNMKSMWVLDSFVDKSGGKRKAEAAPAAQSASKNAPPPKPGEPLAKTHKSVTSMLG